MSEGKKVANTITVHHFDFNRYTYSFEAQHILGLPLIYMCGIIVVRLFLTRYFSGFNIFRLFVNAARSKACDDWRGTPFAVREPVHRHLRDAVVVDEGSSHDEHVEDLQINGFDHIHWGLVIGPD